MKTELFNAVDQLLKSEKGGERFFTKIDDFIKSNLYLFRPWISEIERRFENRPIVLSGEFGRLVGPKNNRILLPGGIRHLDNLVQKIEISDDFVFIDDSLWSGRTVKAAEALTGKRCIQSFIIYNGSKQTNDINNLFRYWDHY